MNIERQLHTLGALAYEPRFVNDIWDRVRDISMKEVRTNVDDNMTHRLYEIFDFSTISIRPTIERFTSEYEY